MLSFGSDGCKEKLENASEGFADVQEYLYQIKEAANLFGDVG